MSKSVCVVLASALLASFVTASAHAKSEQLRFNEMRVIYNECADEFIAYDLSFHVVISTLRNGRTKLHLNLNGNGIGDTGAKYRIAANQKQTFNGADFVAVSRIRIVGKGPSNNEFIIETVSYIDGVFTAEFEIECRD